MHHLKRKERSVSTFCIFTPTYNRASTLPRLYESLVNQTYKDFTWLIIDDGSTDDTRDLINQFAETDNIQIRYIKTRNQGKSRALNRAAALCEDELFFCVDSDDWLPANSLELLNAAWQECKHDPSVAGIAALKSLDGATPIGTNMPVATRTSNAWDLYNKWKFKGDAAFIFRSEVYSQYPSPIIPGEKFFSEGYVHYEIGKSYSLFLLDRIVYLAEYQDNGYSKNVRMLARNNPIGYTMAKRQCVELSKTPYQKLYNSILYVVGSKLCNDNNFIRNAPNRLYAIISIPFALILLNTEFKPR